MIYLPFLVKRKLNQMNFGTKCIHAGVKPDPSTGAIMTPIYQTSTYAQESPGKHKGFEYARTQNPTRTVLENNLAALENGTHGICFGSGLAAMDAVLKLLNPGDEIISTNDLYGGSYRLMVRIYERYGIKAHFMDLSDTKKLEKKINKNTSNNILSFAENNPFEATKIINNNHKVLVTMNTPTGNTAVSR